jgi:hypothetical protein
MRVVIAGPAFGAGSDGAGQGGDDGHDANVGAAHTEKQLPSGSLANDSGGLHTNGMPIRLSLSAYDLCGVYCPELPTYFRREGRPAARRSITPAD